MGGIIHVKKVFSAGQLPIGERKFAFLSAIKKKGQKGKKNEKPSASTGYKKRQQRKGVTEKRWKPVVKSLISIKK